MVFLVLFRYLQEIRLGCVNVHLSLFLLALTSCLFHLAIPLLIFIKNMENVINSILLLTCGGGNH